MRSWLFAEAMGRKKGINYDHEVVAVGTILHDIGLTASVRGAFGGRRRTHGQRFPAFADEAQICGDVLSARHSKTGDQPRQLLARLGERFVPGYKAVSTVDLLLNAPFDE